MHAARLVLLSGLLVARMAIGADAPLDAFGDPLPAHAIQRLGTLRMRGVAGSDCCYLPDGRLAVVSGGRIIIWDMARGEVQAEQRASKASLCTVSPRADGKALLLTDSAGNVRQWDYVNQRELHAWPTGQERLVQAVYSPDGKRVLTLGSVPPTLAEWDLETGRQRIAISETGGMVLFRKAVYAPDGKTAWVGGGYEHVLEQYDLAAGKCTATHFSDYCVYKMLPSADGKRMAVGSRSRASEWDMETGKKLREFRGHHGGAVPAITYCRDPNQILTGSRDGSIRRWDRTTGEILLRWFVHEGYVQRLRVSPDGKWALSCSCGAMIETSLASGKPRLAWDRHDGSVQAAAFLPDGKHVVSGSTDATIRVWDVETGKTTRVISGVTLGAYCLAVSPDGFCVSAGCKDGVVREFNLGDGRLLRELTGHLGYVRAVAYTPDGKRLLSSADDGDIIVWTAHKNEPTARLEGHHGGVLALAVSNDSKQALSGGRDRTLRIWDLESSKSLKTHEEVHRGWIECVCFTPHGKQSLSIGRDGRIVLLDLQSGELRKELRPGTGARALAVSADGSRIYSGGAGSRIVAWDLKTGEKAATFSGHRGQVLGLALSPDGTRLVSGSADTTLLIWDVAPK